MKKKKIVNNKLKAFLYAKSKDTWEKELRKLNCVNPVFTKEEDIKKTNRGENYSMRKFDKIEQIKRSITKKVENKVGHITVIHIDKMEYRCSIFTSSDESFKNMIKYFKDNNYIYYKKCWTFRDDNFALVNEMFRRLFIVAKKNKLSVRSEVFDEEKFNKRNDVDVDKLKKDLEELKNKYK